MKLKNALLISAVLISTKALAFDENLPLESNELQHRYYFSLGTTNIDSEVADQELIDDSATYIRIGWEGKKQLENNAIIFGAGISGLLYSDNAKFKQEVKSTFGKHSTASSSAESFGAYAELGYYHSLNERADLGVFAGYDFAFSSSRSISNCSDCKSEDIDVDTGLYIMPKVKFAINQNWSLSLGYHHYLSGDVENTIAISVGSNF
ncbi:outer membrane beta-barrel protein [Colwelliaceae bacterium 6441]